MREKKACRYCGSEMKASAVLCPTCNSYQDRWRSLLLYLASAAGFLALLASAATFIFSQLVDLEKRLNWKDEVDVIFFESGIDPYNYNVVLANRGDGPVFVSDLLLNVLGGNAVFRINAKINSNDFFVVDKVRSFPEGYESFVSSTSGAPTRKLVENSNIIFESKPCFLIVVFSASATDVKRMDDHYKSSGRRLVSQPADVTLRFHGARKADQQEVQVPAVATFVRNTTDRCRNVSID